MNTTLNFNCKIAKKDVAVFCAYLGAFEGMSSLRNPNPNLHPDYSLISIMVSADFKDEFHTIMQEISQKLNIHEYLQTG